MRPVDGVWVDGALCFGGSPKTRWVRNLQHDARLSVHLPHDDEVVILEGRAEVVTDETHPLATPSMRATRTKYPQYYVDEDTADLPSVLDAAPRGGLRLDAQRIPSERDALEVRLMVHRC